MDASDSGSDYLTIEQAAAFLGLTPGAVRQMLRQYGLGEFVRASMSKQVLIRKQDLLDAHTARAMKSPSRSRRNIA
jgi:hypothetical protein